MPDSDNQQSKLVPKCKAVIIGDQSVGKSSIIQKYVKKTFKQKYNVYLNDIHYTVGIDFISRVVKLENKKQVRLQIWDTGQQRFKSLIPGCLKDCEAAIIVFDITCQIIITQVIVLFEYVQSWMQIIRNSRGIDTLIFIVANKSDRIQQRQVQQSQILSLQFKYSTKINKISVLLGQGIHDFFLSICQQLQKTYAYTIKSIGGTIQNIQEVKINSSSNTFNKDCCFG